MRTIRNYYKRAASPYPRGDNRPWKLRSRLLPPFLAPNNAARPNSRPEGNDNRQHPSCREAAGRDLAHPEAPQAFTCLCHRQPAVRVQAFNYAVKRGTQVLCLWADSTIMEPLNQNLLGERRRARYAPYILIHVADPVTAPRALHVHSQRWGQGSMIQLQSNHSRISAVGAGLNML